MNNDELKQLGQTLIAISEGAEWQYSSKGANTWVNPVTTGIHDCLKHGHQIRLKPRTILVNGIEVPEPLREKPKYGDIYFIANTTREKYWATEKWEDDDDDNMWFERSLLHATAENAIQHAKAMLANNSPNA